MDLSEIRDNIADIEDILFTGCFNESVIRSDLSIRREKRDFYIDSFNRYIDVLRTISNSMELRLQDAALAEKSKKCQKEASRLLDIIYEY